MSPEDMISSVGSNVTFRAQTDAGPGTYLMWIHDPANTICVDESSECFAVNALSKLLKHWVTRKYLSTFFYRFF